MQCSAVPLRPPAQAAIFCGQIKANLGTLNSATDGDMDIAFALLLAAKVRPPCVLETLTATRSCCTFDAGML